MGCFTFSIRRVGLRYHQDIRTDIALFLASACPALTGADRMAIGLAASRATIEALSVAADSAAAPVVLVIGGLDGGRAAGDTIARELREYEQSGQRGFQLLAIPLANPEKALLVFPPTGAAYKENPESHYLWRWIGV